MEGYTGGQGGELWRELVLLLTGHLLINMEMRVYDMQNISPASYCWSGMMRLGIMEVDDWATI